MRATRTIITTLVENSPADHKALRHEHGLSFHLDVGGFKILLDCGASDALAANARILGIDLADLDAVVLSHSHYDHGGGFRAVAQRGGVKRVATGPGYFLPKYSLDGRRHAFIGVDFDAAHLARCGIEHLVCDGAMELSDGCWIVGGFERTVPGEVVPARFAVRDGDAFVPDSFADEICVAVRLGDGEVGVFVGCSHVGIVNILRTVEKRLGMRVRGVWGGTHLVEAGLGRIRATLDRLEAMGVRELGLSHCTGDRAAAIIAADSRFESCRLRTGDGMVLVP